MLLSIGAALLAAFEKTEAWASVVLLDVWAVFALYGCLFSLNVFQPEEHLTVEEHLTAQECELEPRKLTIARGVYYMYNLFPDLTIRKDYEQVASRERECNPPNPPPAKSRLLAQLHHRAAMLANMYATGLFSDYTAGQTLRLRDLERMVQRIKAHRNATAPFVARWHSALNIFAVAYACFALILAIPCYRTGSVRQQTGWLVVGGSFSFVWCFMHSTAGDRELTLLGPRSSAWGVIFMVLYSWLAMCAVMGLLVYTDVCEETKVHYRDKGIVFVVFASIMMFLGMRMYVGKLVDYCELRLELIALGQDELRDSRNGEFLEGRELAKFLSRYTGKCYLNQEDKKRLEEATVGINDRWYIGLIVIFLGLAPTVGKLMQTIWEGEQGNLADLIWEDGPACLSTTAIIVIAILSDRDLKRWMGTFDVLTWIVLAILTLGTQVSGIYFGEGIATVDDGRDVDGATAQSTRAALIIAVSAFLTAQICTAVWLGVKTDVELMTKLYEVDRVSLGEGRDQIEEPIQRDGLMRIVGGVMLRRHTC